ncbi:hypothetical protein [Streptomyces sp. R08]|uniref:Uncharacterized protein n=1 Tax=Streptomyces sp. R08 TaxID=3238624 RepID=A0AB39MQ86_9ACTN
MRTLPTRSDARWDHEVRHKDPLVPTERTPKDEVPQLHRIAVLLALLHEDGLDPPNP